MIALGDSIGRDCFHNKVLVTKDISPYFIEQYKKNLTEKAREHNIHLDVSGVLEDFLQDEEIKIQK